MSTLSHLLPITEMLAPADERELAAAMTDAHDRGVAMFPIGGGTSLAEGTPATRSGLGLSLERLDRVIDYPARDMTVTVEAGVTMAKLAELLAAERQWLPLDVAEPARATIGGVVATAWSGARRYGCGTPRDYMIGISAVDGRGMPFRAGGRVVKNVAGYDFCKLLTGSHGTLATISQLTLKIRPLPECSAFVVCELRAWSDVERLLAALVHTAATPSAIELLAGPHWLDHPVLGMSTAGTVARLAVGLEGSETEVAWMTQRLSSEWRELGATDSRVLQTAAAVALWSELAHFSASRESPLVVKASVLSSRTVELIGRLCECDPQISIQSHAGNGIVIARFSKFESADVARLLVARLHPAAVHAGGHLRVLSSSVDGLTRQAIWGGMPAEIAWMSSVKRQFDPKGLLNPGRFVFGDG